MQNNIDEPTEQNNGRRTENLDSINIFHQTPNFLILLQALRVYAIYTTVNVCGPVNGRAQ